MYPYTNNTSNDFKTESSLWDQTYPLDGSLSYPSAPAATAANPYPNGAGNNYNSYSSTPYYSQQQQPQQQGYYANGGLAYGAEAGYGAPQAGPYPPVPTTGSPSVQSSSGTPPVSPSIQQQSQMSYYQQCNQTPQQPSPSSYDSYTSYSQYSSTTQSPPAGSWQQYGGGSAAAGSSNSSNPSSSYPVKSEQELYDVATSLHTPGASYSPTDHNNGAYPPPPGGLPPGGMPGCPPTPPGSRMHHTPSPNHTMHFLGPPGGPAPGGGPMSGFDYGMGHPHGPGPLGPGGGGPMKRPYHMMNHQNGSNGLKMPKESHLQNLQPKITDHPSYPEKKPRAPGGGAKRSAANKFNGMSEDEVAKRGLPDYLKEGLDVVFIGINPSMFAAYTGRYYDGPGNHFWQALYLSGLIPEPMSASDDHKLMGLGYGFTNVVARTTRGIADLSRKEISDGAEVLKEKLVKYQPKIAVFNGKAIYEVYSGQKKFMFGRQPLRIPGCKTWLWVMPSSSARCAQLPRVADKVPFFMALRKFRDHLNGLNPDLDDSEIVFSNVMLKSSSSIKQQQSGKHLNNVKTENYRDRFCSTPVPADLEPPADLEDDAPLVPAPQSVTDAIETIIRRHTVLPDNNGGGGSSVQPPSSSSLGNGGGMSAGGSAMSAASSAESPSLHSYHHSPAQFSDSVSSQGTEDKA